MSQARVALPQHPKAAETTLAGQTLEERDKSPIGGPLHCGDASVRHAKASTSRERAFKDASRLAKAGIPTRPRPRRPRRGAAPHGAFAGAKAATRWTRQQREFETLATRRDTTAASSYAHGARAREGRVLGGTVVGIRATSTLMKNMLHPGDRAVDESGCALPRTHRCYDEATKDRTGKHGLIG